MRKYTKYIVPVVSMSLLFGFALDSIMDLVRTESEVVAGMIALPLVVLLVKETLFFLRSE